MQLERRTLLSGLAAMMLGASFANAGAGVDAAAAGLDPQALTAMSRHVREADLDIRAMLVLLDGKPAFEWHSALSSSQHSHRVYSVTKSVYRRGRTHLSRRWAVAVRSSR